MLKTIAMLNVFMEHIFLDSLTNRMFKRTAFIWNGDIADVLTVAFDQLNASLLNIINNFAK